MCQMTAIFVGNQFYFNNLLILVKRTRKYWPKILYVSTSQVELTRTESYVFRYAVF